MAWREPILSQNKLLFTADLVREQPDAAYAVRGDEGEMRRATDDIVRMCEATGNRHMLRFANLLTTHMDGITSHAVHPISSGRIEGVNNRIKTIRRQGYGYPDDEYFFLKIIDGSRKRYVQNPKSHRFCD